MLVSLLGVPTTRDVRKIIPGLIKTNRSVQRDDEAHAAYPLST